MNARPQKRRKFGSSREDGEPANGISKSFLQNASNWSLEENYEARARKKKKKVDKNSDRLPIRGADGLLRPQAREPEKDESDTNSDNDDDAAGKQDGDDHSTKSVPARRATNETPQLPDAEQIRNAKEDLAKLALKLNENPEENAGAFKALAQVSQQYRSAAVQRLCLATQMAVYKDTIPGYRIRSFGEEAVSGEKLSSEVRRIRAFEQSLLAGYQAYLKELLRLSKMRSTASTPPASGRQAKKKPPPSLADVALSCACTLLSSVSHFNFREDLLRILVGKLSTRHVDASFVRCRNAIETLFREDTEGRPSMEAVALLGKMMKARDYRVDESVLNTFLSLRLLSEFSGKGSQDRVERSGDSSMANKANKKREFRTKRERKMLKEQKALDRDLAQADALVAHEERERMQSETLKLVFTAYFRILKLRTPHLMGAVLEGLAKYAHLINQDFFGDVLEALKDLTRHSEDVQDGGSGTSGTSDIAGGADLEASHTDDNDGDGDFHVARNPTREALLCTVTAYALLAGQDAHNARGDLHLDLSFFTTRLFHGLGALSLSPDLEKRANSLQQRLVDAAGDHGSRGGAAAAATAQNGAKVNLQTTTVLLVRCLTAILLPPYNIRSVPPLRLAAFTKQLMAAALQVPEKSSQALLALLHDVAQTHRSKIQALWLTEERKDDGTFNPLSETVESSNPYAATVWEGELLRRHYCPKVREGVKALEKSVMMQ